MANVEYKWPSASESQVLGKQHRRVDGIAKSSGAAKYTYDVNLDNQLIVKALDCPHGHCRIRAIDTSAAERVPGVVHVRVLRGPSTDDDGNPVYPEIQYAGELLVAVAAESEGAANEALGQIKVDYEPLEVFVQDDDLEAAERAGRAESTGGRTTLERQPEEGEDEEEFEEREIKRLFDSCAHVVEGTYGINVISHCCLEPHGSTVAWDGDNLQAYLSTQNVSGTDEAFAGALNITADKVTVVCDYIGGGFGSKFAPDSWGVLAAEIARDTGRPVKWLLDRDQELAIGGNRPSGFIQVRLGADENGIVQVWDSVHWGTAGFDGGGINPSVIPYVFAPKNVRSAARGIRINADRARAWRAPNHPQACAMTQTAYDDLAAKMGANSYDIFLKNLVNISSPERADLYRGEMEVAARIMDWNAKWHPHGKGQAHGSVVDGLGMALHQWGGNANSSSCLLRIHPDGGVETFCGTQDLGTGTRTVCAIVVAETLGLPVDAIHVHIGNSKYPPSGPSGGSTTVGAVSESHRRAAQDAIAQIFEKVAAKLGVEADALEALNGRIQVRGSREPSMSWKEACTLLGIRPLEVRSLYRQGTRSPLSDQGVGGVQMAHVEVDKETGVVRVKKFVAVQDMGLIVNRKTATSQIHGAMIMAIAYSLFEQRLLDPATGILLNGSLTDYRLPHLGDIGELVVELYEPESERQRGVIGLGEPPVISGGAAISNAVCNALGVRIPVLPLTPKRVLDTLHRA